MKVPHYDLRPSHPGPRLDTPHDHADDRLLLEAALAGSAMVASADGAVDRTERAELIDFVQRDASLSAFAPDDAMAGFDCWIRRLGQPGGMDAALAMFRRIRGRDGSRLVMRAAERVAAADGEIGVSEARTICLMHLTLFPPAHSLAALQLRMRYPRI
jgi:tellurite resistance protein